MSMLVSLKELIYIARREELTGLVRIKHDSSGKEEFVMFTASDSKIEFTTGGAPQPDWTWHEKKEIERRIGLALARFQKETFGYPDSMTFVV